MKSPDSLLIEDRPAAGILGCPGVKKNQIPLLTQVGLRAFGEAGPLRYGKSRREYYQRVHRVNSSIYRFILSDVRRPVTESNLVGLLSVIPTHKETFEQYIRGRLSQFEFGSSEVLSRNCTDPCDLYLQALYLNPNRYQLMRRLLSGLMRAMAELSRGGIDGEGPGGGVRIYGEAVTKAGKKIMDTFDMHVEGRSKEGNPVYVIHTSPGNPLIVNTRHKLLNAKMQAIATPGRASIPNGMEGEYT